MENMRTYGQAPFEVAVIHGGPGARGEMAPVAREIASFGGVLEPLQTATSLQGQVAELNAALEKNGAFPVTLIGFSWGAWLSFIVAATYPPRIKKLILIGSGPYEHTYIERIQVTRLSRLSTAERGEYESIITMLADPAAIGQSAAFARLGALAAKTDQYDPIMSRSDKTESVGGQENNFHGALQEAIELRRSGKLLELAHHITCPVVAIHGDYDPHPAEGVQTPLVPILKHFRLILLKNCGHKPWIERQAREAFYSTLVAELQ
jgi:pimeloyl-ACP methyl ester carboxylesterase